MELEDSYVGELRWKIIGKASGVKDDWVGDQGWKMVDKVSGGGR